MGSLLYAKATHIREQAKIDAARITQKSGNELRGAQSNLQRFSASLANSRAMDAAGSQINDITGNIARNLDAAATGQLMSRISAAEELGASVAMASAAGVGGSSIEAYNATVRLNRSMQEQGARRAISTDNWLASASRGTTLTNTVAGFDNNVYAANLDFNQYVDHKQPSTFEKIVGVAGIAAATYFGGPQAGAAVAGIFESRQAARNGDFATASSAMTGAVKDGIGAGKSYMDSGGASGLRGQWASTADAKRRAAEKDDAPYYSISLK